MSDMAFHPDHMEREIARLEEQLGALKKRLEAERNSALFGSRFRPDVRSVLKARRTRDQVISRELFADPAWDMLLELYAADFEQRNVSTSELCIASAVPATTALRWIDKLDHLGFVMRRADPLDARRVWIFLSPAAREKMDSYFSALSTPPSTI